VLTYISEFIIYFIRALRDAISKKRIEQTLPKQGLGLDDTLLASDWFARVFGHYCDVAEESVLPAYGVRRFEGMLCLQCQAPKGHRTHSTRNGLSCRCVVVKHRKCNKIPSLCSWVFPSLICRWVY